jgi:hypothetical protein
LLRFLILNHGLSQALTKTLPQLQNLILDLSQVGLAGVFISVQERPDQSLGCGQ